MPPTASTRLLTTHSYAQSKPGRIGYCNLDCNTPQTLTRHNTERKLTQQATCRRSYSSVLHCHTHTLHHDLTPKRVAGGLWRTRSSLVHRSSSRLQPPHQEWREVAASRSGATMRGRQAWPTKPSYI